MIKDFLKQPELQDKFSVSATYCTNICRMIDAHPEIYTPYARLGTRYSKYAFAHAFTFYKKLKNGEKVPPYDITEIKKVISEEEPEEIDLDAHKMFVEHHLKSEIISNIKDWFAVTQIPRDISAKEYSKIVYKAMLSIVTD